MDTHGAYTEVLIRWMDAIDSGRPPTIFGDGLQTMDFVHVTDVARASVMAALSDVSDAVFNVGTGVETSLNDLARMLLKVMGSSLEPQYAEARKINPVPRRLASIDAAARGIGFRATVGLEDGLRGLVEWWRHERATASR
jgi:UDP-glucose 4-epimerase